MFGIGKFFEEKVSFTKKQWEKIYNQYSDMVNLTNSYEMIIRKAERVIRLGAIEADTNAKIELAKKDAEIEVLKKRLENKETAFNYLAKDYYNLSLAYSEAGNKITQSLQPSKEIFKEIDMTATERCYQRAIEELEEEEKTLESPITLEELKGRIESFSIKETSRKMDDYIIRHKFDKTI